MKRTYFIPIIIVLIVLLGVYYPQLNIIAQQSLPTPNTIKIFLYSHHRLITNGSVSVFVFYPTSKGTVFQEIYSASNDQYYQFSVKSFKNWAKHWIKFDIKHKTIIYPSILIFASYSIVNQTTITVLTQTYATPLNISQIIEGRGGENIIINFTTPIIHYIKINQQQINQQQTTTTITTTITSRTQGGAVIIEFIPHVIGWYPNNKSVGPIAIATIVGPPDVSEYAASLFLMFYSKQGYSMNIGFYIAQPSLGKLPVRVSLPGPSLTVYNTNSIIRECNATEIGAPSPYDIGQLYVLGQVAWVNWTEIYYIPHDGIYEVFNFLQVILTKIVAVGNGSAAAPAIYDYRSYLPNTSYNELHNSSVFYSPGGRGGFIAPVYFNNLTYIGSVSNQTFAYGNIYIYGVNSEFQVGLNVGALAAIAMPEASPELLAALSMVDIAVSISSSQQSASVLTLTVTNNLTTPLNVYYANYSALYDINGEYYIIPTDVFYLNYTNYLLNYTNYRPMYVMQGI